jgi:7-cyano-7-deazaguanine reductase
MSTNFPFLNSDFQNEPSGDKSGFTALGHAGSDSYVGLETFPNPGCVSVAYESDEVTAVCPVTGQPDFYGVSINLIRTDMLVESKSLKIWFRSLTDLGIFCEGLAVHIRDEVGKAIGLDADETNDHVQVTLTQKSRGGISITSVA